MTNMRYWLKQSLVKIWCGSSFKDSDDHVNRQSLLINKDERRRKKHSPSALFNQNFEFYTGNKI